ncbi:type II toxin-antitoxin system VapC family toxin [Granulicella mallensis]|uniref:PilT protein domain protein n=1 Tax=Granulicella mallensis (strain ATCC BAA-1857 / DSM 23137 / MP5ACTX8) TaxID=682795 RepID=G8NZP1_GRAMM|nr:type II toxin-antitoxin system VapC family toxin [Granulicella mallensis]AEU39161.1 PilT protein domain protein [Granulicella mallensis MP5ACTX8]
MTGYLLDTHVWLWVQQRATSEVSTGFFPEVEKWQRLGRAYISAVSMWEIARLTADGHIELSMSLERFLSDATRDGGLQLLPLTTQILIESTRLPGDIHRDPADRMLVATAREHGLTLVTRDKALLKYALLGHLNARKP